MGKPNGGRVWDPGRVITFTFKDLNKILYTYGVAKAVPSGCTAQSKEEYDGEVYYHYECKKQTRSKTQPSDYFCYFNENADCMPNSNWGDWQTRYWGGGSCRHRVGQEVTCSCKYPIVSRSLVCPSGRYGSSFSLVKMQGQFYYPYANRHNYEYSFWAEDYQILDGYSCFGYENDGYRFTSPYYSDWSLRWEDRCKGEPETIRATVTNYYPTYGY